MSFAMRWAPGHSTGHWAAVRAVLGTGALALLVGCGGGGDGSTGAGTTGGTSGGSTGTPAASTGAALTLSATTPASAAGPLAATGAQFESGSSNETLGTFASSDPFCRVAVYGLTGSGGRNYYVELSFAKSDGRVGLVKIGEGVQTVLARTAAPSTAQVAINTSARRITFTALVLSSSSFSAQLDGTLDYPSNVEPANRAACG